MAKEITQCWPDPTGRKTRVRGPLLLDVKTIDAAKKAEKPYRLSDGGGLLLDVRPTGAKVWLCRLTVDGKRRDMGLGGFPRVSLAEARKAAQEAQHIAKAGADPIKARDTAKAERKVAQNAEAKAQAPGWKNTRTADLWKENMQQFDPWAALEKMRSAHPPLQEQPYLGPESVVFHALKASSEALSAAHAALEAAHRLIADLYPEVLRIDAARDASIADQELGDANLPPWKRRR
jgi:hypothetical protein